MSDGGTDKPGVLTRGQAKNEHLALRREFPPENEREAGKDYSEGAKVYNLANPVLNE